MDFREVVRKTSFGPNELTVSTWHPPPPSHRSVKLTFCWQLPSPIKVEYLSTQELGCWRRLTPILVAILATPSLADLSTWSAGIGHFFRNMEQNASILRDSIAVLLLHIRVAYHILQAFLSSTSLETIVMISGGFCMGHTAWVAEGRIRRSQRVLVEYDWLRWWEQQHRTAGFVDYCQSVVIIIVSLHHVYYTISVVHTYTKVWNLSSKRLKCFHQSHLKKYSDYRKVSTKITWLIHLLRPIPWNGKRMFRYDIKDFRFDN